MVFRLFAPPFGRRFALEASALRLRGLLGSSESVPASKLFPASFPPARPLRILIVSVKAGFVSSQVTELPGMPGFPAIS